MAKSSIDRLIEALDIVDRLQESVGKHEQALDRILTTMERMEARLVALEAKIATGKRR